MRTFITQDNERFEVQTARDLVRAMRARAHRPCRSQAEWMREVKTRVYQASHTRLDCRSEATFVAGLLKSGLLREEIAGR